MSGTILRGSRRYWRASIALFLAAFSVFAAIYCVQPLLPIFALEFNLTATESSVAISAATGTLSVSLLLVSWLGNRFDRKRLMTFSLLATSALVIAMALASDWAAFILVRALIGIAVCGVPAIAMVYLGEEMDAAALGFGMGMFVGGSAIGGMSGRLLMGLLLEVVTWREALLMLGVAILVNAIGFALLLPKPRNSATGVLSFPDLLSNLHHVVSDRALRLLLLCSFLLMGLFVAIYNYVAFHLLAPPYNLSPAAVAPIFAVYLVGTIASATIGSVAGLVGRRKVLWPMMLVIIAGLLVTLAPPLWAVIVGLAITTFGFFGAHSTASAWVARRSGQARAQGSALYLLAYYAGSSLLGTAAGVGWSFWQWPGVIAACMLFALAGLAAGFKLAAIPPLGQPEATSFAGSPSEK
ncbi:MFS transporter [Pelagibacterium xiamenense]|uniref:MFS transporter n=1 Tax=Pelagibacterium xiamenense TaxID=2901140 RepID=UPI001E516678|nr:MFS transporter [Pelagibacterium xiamenense]MCD7061020.1 MFS transporter [Pelagibacterium xiamenense]